MPVAVRKSPFVPVPLESAPATTPLLRKSQTRVLSALQPHKPGDHYINWPVFTRARMRVVCGFSPTNSMNRILHGVKKGDCQYPGLIELGLVEELEFDIEGVKEYNYCITQKGIECLSLSGADRK